MSYPYYDEVQRAYNELKAEGKIKPRATTEEVEADKGLITQRAGYYSNQRDATIGVLEKLEGNNYLGYSVDILIRTDGTFWDIATDSGGEAIPVNGGPSGPDPELIPRWRKPTKELAQIEDDGNGEPEPEPEPIPDDGVQAILDAIELSHSEQMNQLALIQENVTSQGNETRQLIDHFADQVDYWATIILAVYIRNNRGDDEEEIPEAVAVQRARKSLREIKDAIGR